MDMDFIFDTACPWCFIGKRRLAQAIVERPAIQPRFRWRPFLLNPDMPKAGMDRRQYLERKFGGPRRAQRMLEAAESAGRLVGISFHFNRIERTPNTVDSHRLVRLGTTQLQRSDILDSLFESYFINGEDIGNRDVLASIGARNGLDAARVRDSLDGTRDLAEVSSENNRAHAIGMSGVPGFIFNGRFAIAGAQESAIFLRMLDLALESQVPQPVTIT
ncbi:MAG: DsbA family oxidoreductase [Rhodospirillum sp.]|nr:DsbA family oxidoreductase [Rhodospirillum sp.]MCF8487725.1 DsbA family oxidoreductase [Rhodospirillum sp.]MCF8500397.1 DsbA family oxidoreductase [Rhodospirillum sp.]